MASITEMLELAQAQAPQNSFAQTMTNVGKGGVQGFFEQKRANIAAPTREANLMLLQGKIKQMKMQENMAKSFGLMPYDESELGVAREVAFESLGKGLTPENQKNIQTVDRALGILDEGKGKDRSKAGALQNFFNPKTEQLRKSFSTKGGFSFSVSPKTRKGDETPSGQRAKRSAIETLSVKFAKREYAQRLKRQGIQEEEVGMMMFGWTPTQDQVRKYYPLAEKYYSGDRASFDKAFGNVNRSDDPQGLFDEEAN